MKKIFFSFLLLCIVNSSIAQEIGQIWGCRTQIDASTKLHTIPELRLGTVDTSPKIISIFVHILRRNDGTGGLTNNQVDNWVTHFRNDYIGHNIIILEIGRANLNNTTFYNGITDVNYSTLINTNTHGNAIDIYLLAPDDDYSRASNIPGIALCVGGSYVGTSVLSHEFGHCLGLFHTHSGRGCNDFANCSEAINGSNCKTCGDLVCDTPADPCLAGLVNTSCVYIGGGGFNPDVNNIMSYAPPSCLTRFTQGQIERMHHTILTNNTVFGTRRIFLSGPNTLCSSSGSYTLTPPPLGTIYWTLSSYNAVSVTSSGNPTTVSAGSVSGNVTLSAHIGSTGGTVIATKTITLCPAVISGPSSVCYDGSSFSLSPPPTSSTTWTLTGPFSFSNASTITSTTGYTVTVYRTGSSNAGGTLSAVGAVAPVTITPCTPPTIVGTTNYIRYTGNDFSLSNVPLVPTNFYWTVSDPSRFTLVRLYYNAVMIYLTEASENDPCPITIYAHSGSVNSPVVDSLVVYTNPASFDGPSSIPCYIGKDYYLNGGSMWHDIYWTISNPNAFTITHPYGTNNYAIVTLNYPIYVSSTLKAYYNGPLGTILIASKTINMSRGGSMTSYYSVYPNPVSDLLYIEIDRQAFLDAMLSSENLRTNIDPTFDVRLYDFQSNLLRQATSKGGTVQFNVANLLAGIYYLHIYDGISEKPETMQIVVK